MLLEFLLSLVYKSKKQNSSTILFYVYWASGLYLRFLNYNKWEKYVPHIKPTKEKNTSTEKKDQIPQLANSHYLKNRNGFRKKHILQIRNFWCMILEDKNS